MPTSRVKQIEIGLKAAAEIRALKAEVERLTNLLKDSEERNQSIICVYCGKVSKRTGDWGQDRHAMAEHVVDCQKHPLRELALTTLERDQARAACAVFRSRGIAKYFSRTHSCKLCGFYWSAGEPEQHATYCPMLYGPAQSLLARLKALEAEIPSAIEWTVEFVIKQLSLREEWPHSWDAGFPGYKATAVLSYKGEALLRSMNGCIDES